MDTLSSIIESDRFKEPKDIEKLKRFIIQTYNIEPIIRLKPKGMIIVVNSSSLANTIRLQLPTIKQQLNINYQLSIRIN